MKFPLSDRFVRNHLKTRHLVLLVELGRHGSILHAAEAARMTQPTASKMLSDLEYALGVQLFERLARGISPTWYGEVMIRRAGAALAEMDAAHQEVMALMSGLSGTVSIGTVLTPSTGMVPRAVAQFKQRHPNVHVSIVVDTSKPLVQKLRSGELDMMVGRVLDSGAPSELAFEPLTDEPHYLVARTGHPLSGMAPTLEEVAAAAWIVPPAGSILRDRLTALFLSAGLSQPAHTVEALALPVVATLLMESDMVVALPLEPVQHYLDAGLLTVLPYELGLRMDVYGIITRKQHQLAPGAEALLETLRLAASRRRAIPNTHRFA